MFIQIQVGIIHYPSLSLIVDLMYTYHLCSKNFIERSVNSKFDL